MPAAARRAHPRPARSRADGAAFTMTDAVRVARPFATAESSLPTEKGRLDAESQEWLDALTGTGRRQQEAIERLHELLLRGARFELARRRRALADSRPGDLDDLATQAAADALMAILRKLHTYRGDSRFSTWHTSSRCSRPPCGSAGAAGRTRSAARGRRLGTARRPRSH